MRLDDINDLPAMNGLIRKLGLDSCSVYNYLFLPGDFPSFEYEAVIEPNLAETKRLSQGIPVPFNPAAASGWDCSPRTVQSDMYDFPHGQFGPIAVKDTPAIWEKYLRGFRDFLESENSTARILSLACWNEWTEGAYLEPDEQYGYGKLEAVKKVFGTAEK